MRCVAVCSLTSKCVCMYVCMCVLKAPRRQNQQAEKETCVALPVAVSEEKLEKLQVDAIKRRENRRRRRRREAELQLFHRERKFSKIKAEFGSEAETEAAPGSSFSARCVCGRNTGNNGEGKHT